MSTRTLTTAEELLALPDDGLRHELVAGELTTMTPAGDEHGRIAGALLVIAGGFVREHGRGAVYAAETGFRIATDPDTVRAPDFAFVARERLPEVSAPRGFGRGAPDLAAEVVSPGDTYEAVQAKVLQWLEAGTRLVWVVTPATRTIAVHAPGRDVRMLGEADTLDGGDVLPGFSCRVAEIFG